MSDVKLYISVFTMLAIFMAGISPACAFISGKGMIEICAADGSVQQIEADGAFDPFAEDVPLSEHLEAMEQCSFCFAAAHQVGDVSRVDVYVSAVLPFSYLRVSGGVSVPLLADYQIYAPRGPPVFS
ncbi:MAG: hypothetical protein ACRBCT_02885 [Alphaproteobacteria bacterium]